jgi:hypothetical protein
MFVASNRIRRTYGNDTAAGFTSLRTDVNDVIAEADYIVDIGPEAGEAGGHVVIAGPPDEVARDRHSRTAPFVRKVLQSQKTRRRSGSPDIPQAAPVGEKNR